MSHFPRVPEKNMQAVSLDSSLAQLYLDIAGVIFVVIDKDERITMINRKGCQALGYSEAEIIGKNWFDNFLPESIRDQTRSVFKTLMQGEIEPVEYSENSVLTKHGRERLIAWHNALIWNEDGEIVATLSSGEDITERRQTIEALRQSEERFRALLEFASVGIVIIDDDGSIVFINSKSEEMFGYDRAELVGQPVETLLPEELRDTHIEHRANYLTNPLGRSMGAGLELSARRKDGSNFPVEIGLSHIRTELGVLITSFISDITERKRAEERLKETQRTLLTLMSNLPGMAYRCCNDPNWTMEFVSEGCFELTGYYSNDLIANRKVAYGQLIHPDDHQSARNQVETNVRNNLPFQLSYRLITASGEEKWAWEQGRGVFSPQGELLALEGFVTDQTDRVLAYQTLEQRVEERTQEIERRQRVAEGLRDILTILNSNQPLDQILDHIVVQASQLLKADASAVYKVQDGAQRLTIQSCHGLPADYFSQTDVPLGEGPISQVALTGQPVTVSDVSQMLTEGDAKAQARRQALLASGYRAILAVPLLIEEEIYGSLALYYGKVRQFSQEEIELASTFGDQAVLAIENARLRSEVEQAAVAAERSRLARDLHDAVTQTLFSASLIAEVLPRLAKRNPDEGQRRLEELRQLTRGALAEMRTLLLELRPSRLTEAKLSDLLQQLTEAVSGRARVPITLNIEGECTTLPDVQISLYRIAQEALNNVAKHAQASQATVHLVCRPAHIELSVSDNGRGFTMLGITPDNLGLSIMHERAEAIGATLEIESQLKHGTCVAVVWNDNIQTKEKGQ